VVHVTGNVDVIQHDLLIGIVTASGHVAAVGHQWGTSVTPPGNISGFVQCADPPAPGGACDDTKVVVNTGSSTITLSGLALTDPSGSGATATLTGTITY
jgi:hypothetical protein